MLKHAKRVCTLSIDNVDFIADASNCKIAIDGIGGAVLTTNAPISAEPPIVSSFSN